MSGVPIGPETVGLAIAAFRLTPTAGKLLERMLGPFADEVGRSLVNKTFGERRRRLAERATSGLEAARIEPQEVRPKLLLPIFEHAQLEDDPGLALKWAALLANAANGETPGKVRPIYIDVLSKLTPLDALILERIAVIGYTPPSRWSGVQPPQISRIRDKLPDPNVVDSDVEQGINTLMSFGLVERVPDDDEDDTSTFGDKTSKIRRFVWRSQRPRTLDVCITTLGTQFLLACQMPEPKGNDVR